MTQLTYNRPDAVFFALIDTNGDGVLLHNLAAADVQLSSYDDNTGTYNNAVNVGLECIEGDNGFYYWDTANSAHFQHSKVMLYIHDSVGTAFVQNRVIQDVGGDPAKLNSRLRG